MLCFCAEKFFGLQGERHKLKLRNVRTDMGC